MEDSKQQQQAQQEKAAEDACDAVRSPEHKKLRPDPAAAADERQSRLVLIGLDGGEHSRAAFDFFAKKLRMPGDRLRIVHVAAPSSAVWSEPGQVWHDLVASARQLEKSVTDEWCPKHGIEGAEFVTEFCSGPGPAIIKAAEDANADLVVVGSRGLGTVRRTILGSVSAFVVHHCRAPVIVVPAAS